MVGYWYTVPTKLTSLPIESGRVACAAGEGTGDGDRSTNDLVSPEECMPGVGE